jgi:acyl carrier protein
LSPAYAGRRRPGQPGHSLETEFIVRTDPREKILDAIAEIVAQNHMQARALTDSDGLHEDLGFASLDVAQLIAVLEMELGVDPFARGASLEEIGTVGKLVALYERHLAECHPDQRSAQQMM